MLDEILTALLLFAAALMLCAIILPLILIAVFLLAYIITYPPRFTTCLAATEQQQRLRSGSGSEFLAGKGRRNSLDSAGPVFEDGLDIDCGTPLEYTPPLGEEKASETKVAL